MELRINYANGEMLINLDEHFPTSVKRIKSLIKVIQMDEDAEELLLFVERYLRGQIELMQDDRVLLAKRYSNARTKRVELSEKLESASRPGGVKLSRSAESGLNDELKLTKIEEKEAIRDFDRLTKIADRLKKNLEEWRRLCST